jgi:hypothetical protein
MTDPRIETLTRARLEVEYEWLHKRPCPDYVGFNARERAECERELQAWLPAFERAGWSDANSGPLIDADRLRTLRLVLAAIEDRSLRNGLGWESARDIVQGMIDASPKPDDAPAA